MNETVDWEKFIELEKYRAGTHSERLYDERVSELEDAEILSLKPDGNYLIVSDQGVVCSPRHAHLWRPILHFTKKTDAEKYANLKYSNVLYSVYVARIENKNSGSLSTSPD